MKEVWKDIPNYEGLYQVSNLGRVKSFRRSSKYRNAKEFILKPTLANNGYCQVTLYRSSSDKKKFLVHRLVAESFIPNPDGLPQINHKDEDPANNAASNLEWCTAKYNNLYGTARVRSIDTKSRAVEQYTLEGKLIAIYRSARIASELLGISYKAICHAAYKGTRCDRYLWKYSDMEKFSECHA